MEVILFLAFTGNVLLLGVVGILHLRVTHLRGLLREVAVERDRLLDSYGKLRADHLRINVALTARSEFVQHGMGLDGGSDRP